METAQETAATDAHAAIDAPGADMAEACCFVAAPQAARLFRRHEAVRERIVVVDQGVLNPAAANGA